MQFLLFSIEIEVSSLLLVPEDSVDWAPCSLDWATAVVGEADRELTWVTFTYHSSGPIYETSAQSMELSGTCFVSVCSQIDSLPREMKLTNIE